MAGRHSLVAAIKARIYHHNAPESWAKGYQIGLINILNLAYVALRSNRADERSRASIMPYARFRLAQFALAGRSEYNRERLAGARAAVHVLPQLLNCSVAEIDTPYLRLRKHCLQSVSE